CSAAQDLASQRDEDIPVKISRSLDRFSEFKDRYGDRASNFQVYQTRGYAGFHALAVDLAAPDAMILYSPYFAYSLPSPRRIERGDMPHYFIGSHAGPVFVKIRNLVDAYRDPESLQRLL
nr:hypothetical protein [Micromonospora sp. DSM 115978]